MVGGTAVYTAITSAAVIYTKTLSLFFAPIVASASSASVAAIICEVRRSAVVILMGMLCSYKGAAEFYEQCKELMITQSQIGELNNKFYNVDKYEKEVENKKYILSNLLNQKEITKDSDDAFTSLRNACENLERAKGKLNEYIRAIYVNSGGC